MKSLDTQRTGSVCRTALDNGLVVLTEDIPTLSSASLGVWVHVGSKHESEQEAGLSHFIEHMFFKGTPTRSAYEIADCMEGVGGYLNATTDKEQTCFSSRVMDRHLDMALDVTGDMLRNSLFEPDEMEREKNVVIDEIKTYEDSPGDVIQDLFLRTVWQGHTLGRSTIGYEHVVRGSSRDQLQGYVSRHYRPRNMLVTVAGRVDHGRVVAKAEQWFGDMRGECPDYVARIPEVHNRFVYRHRPTEQVYVCLGGEGLPLGHADKYKMQMLDNVLGGGMSSRLFQEVREKRGLVYSIGSYMYGYLEGGVFGIYAIAGPGPMREVMPIVRDICADIRENGITEREFERSREYLKGIFAIGLESSNARMMRLMRSEVSYGRFVPPEEVVKCIDAVTMEDVNACARRYLDLERYCVAALGPCRGGAGRGLLQSIGRGPWEEDLGPYDKPRKGRRGVSTDLVVLP